VATAWSTTSKVASSPLRGARAAACSSGPMQGSTNVAPGRHATRVARLQRRSPATTTPERPRPPENDALVHDLIDHLDRPAPAPDSSTVPIPRHPYPLDPDHGQRSR
jgi:hypothetical protein